MQPKTRILLAGLIGGLFVATLASRAFVVPYLEKKAKQKLTAWVKEAPVAVRFKDVRILWNGIRITKVKVARGENRLSSDVKVTLGFDSVFPFVKPELVSLDKPEITVFRKTGLDTGKQPAPQTMAYSVAELLDRYFSAGISVQLKQARIRIKGAGGETLLSIPDLTADLNADDRTAQISAGDFYFKDLKVLSEVSGQILLQKQREFYPFLLQARDPGGEPWQLKGQVSHDFDSIDLRHKRKGLPEAWAEKGKFIANPDELLFSLRAKVDGLMTREQIAYEVRVASSNLFIQHDSLGKNPLGPWPITLASQGVFLPDTATLRIQQGHVTLASRSKEAPLALSFEGQKLNLETPLAQDPFRLRFHADRQSCQAVVDSVPENVLPLLDGLKLDGDFALDGQVNLIAQEEILKFSPGMNRMDCRVLKSPEILTRQWLFTPSSDIPAELRQNPALLAVKMGRPVSRHQIPDDFFKALVAAEDAKFWRHDGILIESLLAALESNMKAGHVKFGGSTITMQLAKNLYLDRDKVISRKLQEMALAWVLEQNLSKAEILELYANAVEFAPATYGIGKGTQLYFNKSPAEMSTAESLFLASILPNPSRNFSESFCHARLTRGIKQRMQNVASGLAALSQERDFMKIYSTDLEQFAFGMNLSSCDFVDRSRLSQGKAVGKRF